jgi:hypothetical protein
VRQTGLCPRREKTFDLLKVVEVVAGQQAREVLDGFLAAFGVHAVLLPLLGRERSVESERLMRVRLRVVAGRSPRILIECA